MEPYVPGSALPKLTDVSIGGVKALLDIGANAGQAIREGRLPMEWLQKVAEAVISNDVVEWERLSQEWEESDPVTNAIHYFHRVAGMVIKEGPENP
jgi:hypothetical protein